MIPDPINPATYPRRVLVATLGLAPQVLTETIFALGVEAEQSFIPTEIHVITTTEGAHRARLELLSEQNGRLVQLEEQYGLRGLTASLTTSNLHVIQDAAGTQLEDIDSVEDNSAAADLITGLIRELASDETAAMHVSIAGGRKTMGFLLGYALSLFGRPQDRLSHVLVSSPFESNRDFYFPPKIPRVIHDRDGRPATTADARIMLAEIPVVLMRDNLPPWVKSDNFSYSETVRQAQQSLHRPVLIFDVKKSELRIGENSVRLRPQTFAVGLWLATHAIKADRDDWVSRSLRWDNGDWAVLVEQYASIPEVTLEQARHMRQRFSRSIKEDGVMEDRKDFFSEQLSRLRKAIRQGLGPSGRVFVPETRKAGPGISRYGFDLSADSFQVLGP